MSKPVFLISNYSRKLEFQTQTRATKEKDGNIVFQKIALNSSAIPHLEKIKKTSDTLTKMGLGPLFCKAIPNKGGVEFQYIKGESIENLLLKAILSDNQELTLSLLDEYEEFLGRIAPGTKHKHSHKYDERTFGPDFYEKFSQSGCVYPGILDLNFDNIISDKSKKVAIDYEWAFEHCLPYDYILARAIMWFGMRYADTFKMHSEHLDFMGLSDENVLPSSLFSKYSHLLPLIKKAYYIEWKHFQPWVNGSSSKVLVDFYKQPAKYSQRSLFAIDKFEAQAETQASLIQHLNEELKSKNTEIERQNNILRRYPHRAIHKAYRAGGKLKGSVKKRSS